MRRPISSAMTFFYKFVLPVETLRLGESEIMKTFVLRFLTVLVLVVVTASCKSLTISINDTNPPVFTFSAGQFAECCDHLSFLMVWEVPTEGGIMSKEAKVIWKISPDLGTDNSANKLPRITYGEVPSGFTQIIPEVGPPPRLEEGKEYEAGGPLVEIPHASVRFRIQDGKAVWVSKKK